MFKIDSLWKDLLKITWLTGNNYNINTLLDNSYMSLNNINLLKIQFRVLGQTTG